MTLQEQAQPGDAVFYRVGTSSAFVSKLIAVAELFGGLGDSPRLYSHVGIYIGNGQLIEAYFPRCRLRAVDWDNPNLELWRVRGATPAECVQAIEYANNSIGDIYNFVFCKYIKGLEYCSELYNQAYAAAGLNLASQDKIISPDDLIASGKLDQMTVVTGE